jgi:predicted Zn-dependent protease with MMP-like domain
MADWNFEDFLRRLKAIKGVASFEELIEQVPGLAQILSEVDFQIEELDPIETILRSMTLEERLNPDMLSDEHGPERRERIARDSGSTPEAVESLIDQFQRLRAMLQDKTPEEVLRETIQQQQPELEDWQGAPDAWKSKTEPPADGVFTVKIVPEDEASGEPVGAAHAVGFELNVDDLLRKIAAEGMAALTADERTFLDEASQRFRNRRERR